MSHPEIHPAELVPASEAREAAREIPDMVEAAGVSPLDASVTALLVESKLYSCGHMQRAFDRPLMINIPAQIERAAQIAPAHNYTMALFGLNEKSPHPVISHTYMTAGAGQMLGLGGALGQTFVSPTVSLPRAEKDHVDSVRAHIDAYGLRLAALLMVRLVGDHNETRRLDHATLKELESTLADSSESKLADRWLNRPRYTTKTSRAATAYTSGRGIHNNHLLESLTVLREDIAESMMLYNTGFTLLDLHAVAKANRDQAHANDAPRLFKAFGRFARRAAMASAAATAPDTDKLPELYDQAEAFIKAVAPHTDADTKKKAEDSLGRLQSSRDEYVEHGEASPFYDAMLTELRQTQTPIYIHPRRHNAEATENKPAPERPRRAEEFETIPNMELEAAREAYKTAADTYAGFLAPFHASNRQLRKLGLYDVSRTLTTDHGMLDTVANRLLANLAGLDSVMRQTAPEDQPELLPGLLSAEQSYVDELERLRRAIHQAGGNGVSLVAPELAESAEWLITNREAFSLSLIERLPAALAAHYIDLLERLTSKTPMAAAPEAPASDQAAEEPAPVVTEDIVEPETDELPDAPPITLEKNIADQLDWELFPADASLATVRAAVMRSLTPEQAAEVDWARIRDLYEIKQTFGGELYRGKPRTLGAELPYFVTVVQIDGEEFAIAENPTWANATYVLRTTLAEYGASWQAVYAESRFFARMLGAEQVVHTRRGNQLDRIMAKVQDLLLVKPRTANGS